MVAHRFLSNYKKYIVVFQKNDPMMLFLQLRISFSHLQQIMTVLIKACLSGILS